MLLSEQQQQNTGSFGAAHRARLCRPGVGCLGGGGDAFTQPRSLPYPVDGNRAGTQSIMAFCPTMIPADPGGQRRCASLPSGFLTSVQLVDDSFLPTKISDPSDGGLSWTSLILEMNMDRLSFFIVLPHTISFGY